MCITYMSEYIYTRTLWHIPKNHSHVMHLAHAGALYIILVIMTIVQVFGGNIRVYTLTHTTTQHRVCDVCIIIKALQSRRV